MDFYEVLEKVIELLQRHGRLTYRALKLQFKLDDEALEALKDELFFAHPVVDEDGRGLVWTGDSATLEPEATHETDAKARFHAILPVLTDLLQREGRVTYHTLKQIFVLNEKLLEDLRKELTLRRLAIDEDGEVLAWTGETQRSAPVAVSTSRYQDTPDIAEVKFPALPTPPPVTEPAVASTGPMGAPETISAQVLMDEPSAATEPSRSTPEAERRQLTVMFCDLADSTKLSQQLDPEDLRDVVRAYQGTAAEVIEQYEGHMAQYLGDGLLIYFGWPVAHEDDAQRALYAGLGIVKAITTMLNPRLEQEKGAQLAVRLGVHTGPVVVGEMGGGRRHENLATGETVNIASRLEGVAAPNTVVVSHVTARMVRGVFELEDLGPQKLKGVAKPMHVFRALGPAEVHGDEDDSLPDGGVFLVGRDEEIGLLLRRWEQSKEGLGQVVLISGEAGIGKSSLVATIRLHVMQEGYTRMTFRCSPYHTNSALYPVITHLEHVMRFEPDDTAQAKLGKLEQALGTTRLPLAESVPLLATLLSVPLPDDFPAPELSPQQQRQQTLDTLVEWLMEEAGRQPLLAMWEDLHWADPSTLEMLGLVLEQTPTVPMLHLLTYRPEFEAPWATRSHMTPLTLNRLERLQVEAIILHMAGRKVLPEEVIEHIVAKTDGVPLYVEELTKMLLESDFLDEETDQYVLTGPLFSMAIPDTLQDSLMARLDQLNTAKEVAQLGAVLGREFSYDMLQAISSQDANTLQADLKRLVEAELLYQRGRPPRAMYIFKHALIQDAAYASLLRNTRQQVHQRVALLLEGRFPDTASTQPELVAHHYTEAGFNAQAIPYWQRAGQRASQRSANLEAVHHLTKGLQLLTGLPDAPERLQEELTLQIALGPVMIATKGYAAPEVKDTYVRARELCQQVGDTPQLFPSVRGLAFHYTLRADYHKALELGKQLLPLGQRAGDPMLMVEAHRTLAAVLYWSGELHAAAEHATQGNAHYVPQQHRNPALRYGHDSGSACLCYAAMTGWHLGYPEQARSYAAEALTLAQSLSHTHTLCGVLSQVTMVYIFRRDILMVQESAEAIIALATEQSFPMWLSCGIIFRGWARIAKGKDEEGLVLIQQGLDAWHRTETRLGLPWFLAMLAEAHGKLGQIDEGLKLLAEAQGMVDETGERWCEAELHRLKGELLLQLPSGNHTEAESCFYQAFDIARRQQAKSWELRAATSLARLWQSQGKRQEAYELLAPVYGWFTEGFDTADLREAKGLLP